MGGRRHRLLGEMSVVGRSVGHRSPFESGTEDEPMAERRPLDRAIPLSGLDLRHAALAIVQRRGCASIAEIEQVLAGDGFTVAGPTPNKRLADALRHEVRLGRLRRVRRGCYAIDRLNRTTAWRARRRWQLASG
jgi:hypothetical protein